MSDGTPEKALDTLLLEHRTFDPSPEFRRSAIARDPGVYAQAAADPESFWASFARELEWIRPYDRVLEWKAPDARWFVGGRLNASANCLDRHLHSARRHKAALVWEGEPGESRIYTYQQLHHHVCKFANVLKRLGVGKGDRVCIYLPMVPEAVIAMLACARIGAVHSVVFGGFSADALKDRIQDAGAKLLVTADGGWRRGQIVQLKKMADEALKECPTVQSVVLVKRGDFPCHVKEGRDHWWHRLMDEVRGDCPYESMDSEAPLFILYTSGTTGKPKGVVHATGGYMVGVTWLSKAFYQIGERDIYWSTSDIGWIVGHSFIVYGPLSVGATVFCREGVPDWPTPEVTWELCERFGVNLLFTAPTAVRMWMSHGPEAPSKYDLSKLRLIACAGEPLNPEAHLWSQKHLVGQSGGMVVDNFWQTEIAAPVLGTMPTFEARPGKVGKPIPGVDAAIVDAQGNALPDGHGGLLVLRKPVPYMLRTVWGDHARYEKYWQQIPGCYAAGDIAVRDRDGWFAVLGRADDVMNVAGHRIGTADVEGSLIRHPAVAESAVVGLPDPVKGERIKAFVVLKAGFEEGAGLIASLKDHVRQDLGPIAQPSEIEIRKTLPKTRSGKIVRRYLKAVEMGEDPGDLSTLAD